MSTVIRTLLATLMFSLMAGPVQAAHAPLPLLPMPAHIQSGTGALSISATTTVSGNNEAARTVARQFIELLPQAAWRPIMAADGDAGTIQFALDPNSRWASPEAYALDAEGQSVRIRAGDARGLFYGAVTLGQLLDQGAVDAASVPLPALTIDDAPRFAWRGLMLDSVRHMQSVDEVKRLIDQMARHKLNVLHWHLTDDQGWRVEIKRYPKLTEIGAWRTPPEAGREGVAQRYGGFYTQGDIRAVVAYAAQRHITIVPEFDMPGHAQAAVAAYPEIGVTGERPAVSVDWGINPWLFNVDEDSFTFIQNVLDELMDLFPGQYIHVGGDEAIKNQWQASKAIQAKIKELGLADENALQGWFIGRLGQYLAKHDRKLIGWDEILEGENLPTSATVMSWRGSEGGIKAAFLGHDVVMAPAPTLYLDHVQSNLPDEYSGRGGVESLRSIYDFQIVPGVLSGELAKHVLGLQANMWTEHMSSFANVQHNIFPRIAAVAENAWSPASAHDWRGFLARLATQLARYRAQDVQAADSAFAVAIEVDRNLALATGRATVRLSNQVDFGAIHYTLDGSDPTVASPRYEVPFVVDLPVTVRATSFAAHGTALAAVRERVLDAAHLLSLSSDQLPNCPGSNFRLHLQPTPDASSVSPTYAVNVFDTCQMFPATRLDGVTAIHVEAARLVRNYALAGEQKLVISRPHATPFGELEVRLDRCDGDVLASMPLPDPATSPRQFVLDANLPAQTGERSLCLIFTAPIDGPLYGLGRVSLQQKSGATASAPDTGHGH